MDLVKHIGILVLISQMIINLPTYAGKQFKYDSLENELHNVENQHLKIDILNNIAGDFVSFDTEKALEYVKEAIYLSQQINYTKGLADSYFIMGSINSKKENYDRALVNFKKSLELIEKTHLSARKAEILSEIAIIYSYLGNDSEALNYQIESLRISSSLNLKKQMARSYNHMGIIYNNLNEPSKSLEFHGLSKEISQKIDDVEGIIRSLNNMGIVYRKKKEYLKAIKSYMEAKEHAEKIGEIKTVAVLLGNIGTLYDFIENYDNSLKYHLKSLKLKQQTKNIRGECHTLHNIGSTYLKMENLQKALSYFKQSLQISLEYQYLSITKDNYESLSLVYAKLKNFKLAIEFYEKYTEIKDSLFNEQNTKKIIDLQSKYERVNKEKEIELLKKEQEYKKLTLRKNKDLNFLILSSGTILLLALFFMFRAFRQKQAANAELKMKNEKINTYNEEKETQRNNLEELYKELIHRKEEVESQKEDIAYKHQYITDSILYAQIIQQAVLDSPKTLKRRFEQSFILHFPKEIVSGDFFWMKEKDGKIYFAAVDCTGHGVPGAFMSIVSHNLLNQALLENDFQNPADMLNHLNRVINTTLHYNYEKNNAIVKDGMDIALCAYDNATSTLDFAGAFNPLYHVSNKILTRYKADSQPIEVSSKKSYLPFTNHSIQINKEDIIYLFSNGFVDQFGGEEIQKFSRRKLRETLIAISHLPMEEQKEKLQEIYYTWKKDEPQVDDVLVVGIKF